MRILVGPFGIMVFCTPAQTIEPVNEIHETEKFDVEGGHYHQWTGKKFAPPTTESPHYEIRFVITGINKDEDWNSNIGFFFKGPSKTYNQESESTGNRKADYRLRIIWEGKESALFPQMSYMKTEGNIIWAAGIIPSH